MTEDKSTLGVILSTVANKPGCVQPHRPVQWNETKASIWAKTPPPADPWDRMKHYEEIRMGT